MTAPKIEIHSNWQEVRIPFHIGSGRSIYGGWQDDSRLRLRVFRNKQNNHLVGRAWFGPGTDGPPLHVHGGALAYVLDEAMGSVLWMNNYPAMAARIEVDFLRPSPIGVDFHLEAFVVGPPEGRRIDVEARLLLPTGEICAESYGEFAHLTRSKVAGFQSSKHDPEGLLKSMPLIWAEES